eukprot:CAMPEP_0168180188 /NCGR_PEP_ID=MMETSP0139_2-20121125/10354_1 /TAXON_ID=44445 /ORGANISM="Pseudo-nitzschia australis, Strain 10249 10 AB" /LENGTH=159 /DNA_ID=CAMNT_0008100289 /DNA_START=247 /DNA_END=726 /DNA_ORIENTATION=-
MAKAVKGTMAARHGMAWHWPRWQSYLDDSLAIPNGARLRVVVVVVVAVCICSVGVGIGVVKHSFDSIQDNSNGAVLVRQCSDNGFGPGWFGTVRYGMYCQGMYPIQSNSIQPRSNTTVVPNQWNFRQDGSTHGSRSEHNLEFRNPEQQGWPTLHSTPIP